MQYSKSFLHDQSRWEKDWFVLGIGQQEETNVGWDGARVLVWRERDKCLFLACSYPRAAALRCKLGLSPKDFHITLGFNERDLQDCYKGVHSILHNQPDFLETSSSRIISTSADLVEAARTAVLGGNPKFWHARILLDAAEGIIGFQKPRVKLLNSHNNNASSLLSLFHNQRQNDELLLVILQMRHHKLGHKRDVGNMIEYAHI